MNHAFWNIRSYTDFQTNNKVACKKMLMVLDLQKNLQNHVIRHSKWIFVPNLKKFSQGVPDTNTAENEADRQPENMTPLATANLGTEA